MKERGREEEDGREREEEDGREREGGGWKREKRRVRDNLAYSQRSYSRTSMI